MVFKLSDIIIAVVLNLVHIAQSDGILSCNETALEPCPGDFQVCNVTSHQCFCDKGYELVNDQCVSPNDHASTNHNMTTAIITIFTLVLIVSGLVLVVRKYNLIEIVRQKIIMRRNNDVMYEDVMIGNDDPPLSP